MRDLIEQAQSLMEATSRPTAAQRVLAYIRKAGGIPVSQEQEMAKALKLSSEVLDGVLTDLGERGRLMLRKQVWFAK